MWAKEHINWSIKQWNNVLWSDESKFEVFGCKRRTFVRRMQGERSLEQCTVPTVKHGGQSIMVWGCFGNGKVGDIHRVDGILNKEGYLEILKNHALPSGHRLIGNGFIYQQDNDPKHSSQLCTNYLKTLERR